MGKQWKLSINAIYHLKNNNNPRLDSAVINARNSIGFRGEHPSDNINSRLTLLTSGRSTTAGTYFNRTKNMDRYPGEKITNPVSCCLDK